MTSDPKEALERLSNGLDALRKYSGAVTFPGDADLRISDIRTLIAEREGLAADAVTALTGKVIAERRAEAAELLLRAALDALEPDTTEAFRERFRTEVRALLHPTVPVEREDAYAVIAEVNRAALLMRAGVKDRSREPLLGPPDDMAVSRVLLAERPDFDPKEADRLAVKITDAIRALSVAPPSQGKPEPNPAWEALADAAHAAIRAEVGASEPEQTLIMLKTWKAHAEPANERGQISFSRALLDSAADALEAVLQSRQEDIP